MSGTALQELSPLMHDLFTYNSQSRPNVGEVAKS